MEVSFMNCLPDQVRPTFPTTGLPAEWLAVHSLVLSLPWTSLDPAVPSCPFYGSAGFSHVHIFQNAVIFHSLFSFHTLSLGYPTYTCSVLSKLNIDDFAQWFTLNVKQTSPISLSKPELFIFSKLALSIFLIIDNGTAPISLLKTRNQRLYGRLLSSPLSHPLTHQIPLISLLSIFSLSLHHFFIDSLHHWCHG